MITGSIWEKVVFGRYLFAPAFFWEDVFSMLVLALHTAYLVALCTGALDARGQMLLALAAYATYVDQRHAVPAQAARGAARRGAAATPCAGGCLRDEQRVIDLATAGRRRLRPGARCCASAASARCSAA